MSWLWTRRADATAQGVFREFEPQNPLELLAAFLFAALFLAMLVATQLAVTYLGKAGVNTLAAIMGLTDVDSFIRGMTQAAGSLTPLKVAAAAVLIAAASNNFMKGIYAYILADRPDLCLRAEATRFAVNERLGSPDPFTSSLLSAEQCREWAFP